ncbi:hypothetical protein HPB49_000277 [Dermacentor silvarum]|uniref:Uncharacterized protein n=1 Tax=Dermacentor silvarum TaxID=543639 RepID=A0ACB8D1B3_DERSI|nr:hypothetical protein HPB49_000277 [Dermacentor silvarum]
MPQRNRVEQVDMPLLVTAMEQACVASRASRMTGETSGNGHKMEIEKNSQDSAAVQTNMALDENSGKTLSQAGPWFQAIKAKKKQGAERGPHTRGEKPRKPSKPARRTEREEQPDCLKDEKMTKGLARASSSLFKEFCANVIIQTQWKRNLIFARTADEIYALKLGSINIELGAATYVIMPYIKPLLGTIRGVVHGITARTTGKRLAELLAANNCGILHAKMLGKSTSAVIPFEGPHVPFYVKVASSCRGCRPYRRSVQYCKARGEVGHRQDVCPKTYVPDTGIRYGRAEFPVAKSGQGARDAGNRRGRKGTSASFERK